jgi:hypothetical protein
MEQFKFDFGKQEDNRATNRLRQIEKHSEAYLINDTNGNLITIGQASSNKTNKIGESHAK